MFYFDYPKVKPSLGQAALHDPYPAWLLDPRGVILATNLMAFWLCDMLRPGEPLQQNSLLGKSVFSLLADRLERTPPEQNIEFYTKKAAIVKRVDPNLESPLYASFIAAMKAHPLLASIYEQTTPNPNREWEYVVRIVPPGQNDAANLLEFQVTNFLLHGDTGFLTTFIPTPACLPLVEKQFSLLKRENSDTPYVLSDNTEQEQQKNDQFPTSLKSFIRTYYPGFIQDPLWYIVEDNRAHQLLVGESVVGSHFFELFFAPQLRQWMGPIQETSAPRAIKYFDTFTANFLRENHELHAAYVQIIQRLRQLPDFQNLLDTTRKMVIHINLPDNTATYFYTCRVLLPWALSQQVVLQFRSMVRIKTADMLIQTDRQYYQVTLVPENYETEIALILLHLLPTDPYQDDIEQMALKQFLWGLTIITTIKEGVSQDEGHSSWEPEAAFDRIYSELNAEFSAHSEHAPQDVLARIQAIIEEFDSKGLVEKEAFLTLLLAYVSTKSHVDQLRQWLEETGNCHFVST